MSGLGWLVFGLVMLIVVSSLFFVLVSVGYVFGFYFGLGKVNMFELELVVLKVL